MAQPAVELLVLRRLRVFHADDDPQIFRKPHLRVALAELLEELQAARRQVVGLGGRQAEVRLAQPALGQHREPRRAVDQDQVVDLARLGEKSANALAQVGLAVAFGYLALEQRQMAAAQQQFNGARIVDVGNPADSERPPVHGRPLQHGGDEIIDEGAVLRLHRRQPVARQQHRAEARVRIGVDDQHLLVVMRGQRLRQRENEGGLAHSPLGIHHGDAVTHVQSSPGS